MRQLVFHSKFATNFELDHGPSIVDGNDRPVNSLALTRDQKDQTLKLDLDEAIGISFLIHINQALPISFLEVDNNLRTRSRTKHCRRE
jgi:hypothetical protein